MHDAKANEMDKKASAKLMLQKSTDGKSTYRKSTIHQSEATAVLKELIGYEGTLKLYEKEEQLAQKFASFFPEQTSEQDRVAAFLSQDVTLIRQDYIQTFSPPPDPRKKKRSRRERE